MARIFRDGGARARRRGSRPASAPPSSGGELVVLGIAFVALCPIDQLHDVGGVTVRGLTQEFHLFALPHFLRQFLKELRHHVPQVSLRCSKYLSVKARVRLENSKPASGRCCKQLDDELIGLAPVKQRIREIAALLPSTKCARHRLAARSADAAHELHRATPAPARRRWRAAWRSSCTGSATAARPPGRGDARRPRRPVHRPHRAEDEGGPEEGDGRRAVHRRGVLSLSPRERARLRPGSRSRSCCRSWRTIATISS